MTISSKAHKLKKFAILDRRERLYLAWLKQHSAVDRSHYRETHRRLPWLFRTFPERHYVAFGERIGLSPRPDFAPLGYRRLNPDLELGPEPEPLRHYIDRGRTAGLGSFDDVTDASFPLDAVRHPKGRCRHAIVLHLYYLDLWPEFERALSSLDFEFDLFVTLSYWPAESKLAEQAIRKAFPSSLVLTVPNRGRDFLPFMYLLNSGALDDFEMVCKLHGKRSTHRGDGDDWRLELVEDLLPDKETQQLVTAFAEDDRALVMTSARQIRSDRRSWGTNRERMSELLARVGMTVNSKIAPFPAGSMFWAKQELITWLRDFELQVGDFEAELGQLDGTTAHALERLVGHGARHLGGTVVSADDVQIENIG